MKQLMGNGFKRKEFSLGLASKCLPHLRPALTPLRDPFHLLTAPCMGAAAAGTPGALPGSGQGLWHRLTPRQEWAPGRKAGGQTAVLQPPSSLHRQDQDQCWLPASPEAGKHRCQDQDTTRVCTYLACLSIPRSGADPLGRSR